MGELCQLKMVHPLDVGTGAFRPLYRRKTFADDCPLRLVLEAAINHHMACHRSTSEKQLSQGYAVPGLAVAVLLALPVVGEDRNHSRRLPSHHHHNSQASHRPTSWFSVG